MSKTELEFAFYLAWCVSHQLDPRNAKSLKTYVNLNKN